MSGRTRKKAESKEEHDRRLQDYAEMERKRRERYEAPLVYDSDDDDDDEVDEKRELEAEQLVEQLEECEDMEAEEDKENRPPATDSSFPWEDDCCDGAADGRGGRAEKATATRWMSDDGGGCMVVDVMESESAVNQITLAIRSQEVVN